MEILIIVWAVCAVFSGVIASSKGRSGFGWFLLGALFGVFAMFAVGVMPAIERVMPDVDNKDETPVSESTPLWVVIPLAAVWIGAMAGVIYAIFFVF